MAVSPVELFDRYHLAVFRYLLRATGRRDVAEDLTQDVFLRVVRRADACAPGEGERAWLFRIARNLVIDRHRHLTRQPPDSSLSRELPCDAQQELAVHVQQALEHLQQPDSEAFLLRVVGGLGHDEIASITSSTAAAVRSRIFRARSALRAALADSPSRGSIRRLRVVP